VTTPKNYLIALLALTTLGGAWFAWRQRAELAELRAAALNKDERADLQKRLWDLEKLNRELRDQLAMQRGPGGEGERSGGLADGERPNREFGGRGGRGDPRRDPLGQQFTAIRDLMAKPEVQAMLNQQQQSALDGRYAALFKNLNLPSEQVDRLKTLLAERATTVMDVMSAARDQGIDPRQNPDAFRKLVSDAQDAINTSIKGLIGDSGFAQLTSYEQTLPQRNVVNQLEQRLSYTSTPLTPAQSEQLVQILAKNSPATAQTNNLQTFEGPLPGGGRGQAVFIGGPPPGRGGPDVGGMVMSVFGPGAAPMVGMMDMGRGSGTATVTPNAIAEAQTILSPPQTQALQQIQQQQQAQQQLKQMVHDTMTANVPPPPSGAPPTRKPPGGN
jgi:hypothetical protein